jgi:hypothetical protein
MRRWKPALATLWRTEPAFALGLYFLLAVAQVGYLQLAGSHLGASQPGRLAGTVLAREGPAGSLVLYAYFTWRMWLGGYICWTLSLVWRLTLVVAALIACYRAPGLFILGLLGLNLAGVMLLFMPAVLRRVDRSDQAAQIRALRRTVPGAP